MQPSTVSRSSSASSSSASQRRPLTPNRSETGGWATSWRINTAWTSFFARERDLTSWPRRAKRLRISHVPLSGIQTASSDPVEAEDVQAIWSTMRIRGSRAPLDDLVPLGDIPEVDAMDGGWELMTLDEETWRTQAVPAIRGALERLNPIPGMGPAIMTKLLGLKRPRLVPLCDSYVLDLIGVAVPTERERRHQRPGALIVAIELLRTQGQANLQTLRAIQERLARAGYERDARAGTGGRGRRPR
jgi:hypothetical protein